MNVCPHSEQQCAEDLNLPACTFSQVNLILAQRGVLLPGTRVNKKSKLNVLLFV